MARRRGHSLHQSNEQPHSACVPPRCSALGQCFFKGGVFLANAHFIPVRWKHFMPVLPKKHNGLSLFLCRLQWHVACVVAGMFMDMSYEGISVQRRSPAVLLVVEDDKDMRSLLCDELWGSDHTKTERGHKHRTSLKGLVGFRDDAGMA